MRLPKTQASGEIGVKPVHASGIGRLHHLHPFDSGLHIKARLNGQERMPEKCSQFGVRDEMLRSGEDSPYVVYNGRVRAIIVHRRMDDTTPNVEVILNPNLDRSDRITHE